VAPLPITRNDDEERFSTTIEEVGRVVQTVAARPLRFGFQCSVEN